MLGLNTRREDRVILRRNVTCSPSIRAHNLSSTSTRDKLPFLDVYLGPVLRGALVSNITYSYNLRTDTTGADYLIR